MLCCFSLKEVCEILFGQGKYFKLEVFSPIKFLDAFIPNSSDANYGRAEKQRMQKKQKTKQTKKPKEVWVLISHFVGIFRLSSNHCFPFSLVQIPDSVIAHGLRVLPWDSLPQHYSSFGILSCSGFILLLCSSLPSTENVASYVQPGQGISTSLGLLLCFLKRLAPRSPPHKGKALAQHRQGWESSGWVTLPPSHLCSLDSPMTTEPFSFQSVCAMDMASRLPGFLEECSLQYRRQNHGWRHRNDCHRGFLCS